MAVDANPDEGKDAEPQAAPVERGLLALDDTALLQAPDAPPTWRRRHADLVGKLLIGEAPLHLERAQDPQVSRIKLVIHQNLPLKWIFRVAFTSCRAF
jgi:hypothetical protein